MDIKDIIKLKREELGLTYEELGKMIGVGKSTVRKWETGMIENMRRDNIVALAKALNISPALIMGWKVDSEEQTILTKKEKTLIENYKELNDIGKSKLIDYSYDLKGNSNFIKFTNDLRVAEPQEEYNVEAAHSDGLTNDEISEMDRKIAEFEKNNR